MYYVKTMEDKVRVPPEFFGSTIDGAVLTILRDRFERRLFKDLGVVLVVDNVEVLTDGVIIPGDGGAYYGVKFEALTFMPFVNEVFEGEIAEVVEFGAFVSIGPLQGLLHVSQISKEKFFYDKKSKNLTSKIEKHALKKADLVLIKVSTVSLKATTAETKIGLTMRPDGLGKHEWLDEKEKKAVAKKKEPKEVKPKEKEAKK